MIALILQATPFCRTRWRQAPDRLHAFFPRAFDAFSEARMRNAVPQWLRRAQRELDRCRRLMRAKNKLPVKAVRTGR